MYRWTVQPGESLAGVVVLNGGPMDGREHLVEGDANELCVVMTDGQQHRYLRGNTFQILPRGGSAPVFEWTGRYHGPK
jgi:hypothetical protein